VFSEKRNETRGKREKGKKEGKGKPLTAVSVSLRRKPTAEFYSGAAKITLGGANFQRACGM